VAKNYGVEYPERPLMAVLSDLLSIPHFTTSNGGTVRSDFLRAVLVALGGDPRGLDKNGLIKACVEASGMPFVEALWSPGGTVTNEALQVMVDGISAGRPGAIEDNPVVDVGWPADVEFDPHELADTRRRQLAERAVRVGQDHFRTAVLSAYGRACALTGDNAVGALEAAHITPYVGVESNVISNGICLRADLHRLWDGGQIALHEESGVVLLDQALLATTYAVLHRRTAANLPRTRSDRPSRLALVAHRRWCGLD
jgi:hypothetical protein